MQLGSAEVLEPTNCPVQEFPDDGLRGCIPRKRNQEPLHGGRRRFFTHRT
jgi:hypothetical protein